jgi:hypothetical protein
MGKELDLQQALVFIRLNQVQILPLLSRKIISGKGKTL